MSEHLCLSCLQWFAWVNLVSFEIAGQYSIIRPLNHCITFFYVVFFFILGLNEQLKSNPIKYVLFISIHFQTSISKPGDPDVVGLAVINTVIGGSTCGIVVLFFYKFVLRQKWSYLVSLNGALTGELPCFLIDQRRLLTNRILSQIGYFSTQINPVYEEPGF
jgi:hypothetical protein